MSIDGCRLNQNDINSYKFQNGQRTPRYEISKNVKFEVQLPII